MKGLSQADHINAFDNRLANGQFKSLTSDDIAYYKALVSVCNRVALKQFHTFRTEFPFKASSKDLYNLSHVGKNTAGSCRKRLEEAGLIEYEKGGGRSVASTYIVKHLDKVSFTSKNDEILSQNWDSNNEILSQNWDSKDGILYQNRDSIDPNTVPELGTSKDIFKSVYKSGTHTLLSDEIPDKVKPAVNEWFRHLKIQKKLSAPAMNLHMESIIAAVKKYGEDEVIEMINCAIMQITFTDLRWPILHDMVAKSKQQTDRVTIDESLIH